MLGLDVTDGMEWGDRTAKGNERKNLDGRFW